MSRIIRSMTYRLLHNKIFYAIFAVLIIAEAVLFLFGNFDGLSSETLENHSTFIVHNHETESEEEVYVSYEEEDPLLINKLTQNVVNGVFDHVPGQTYKYRMSIYNVASVSMLLAITVMLIFAADAVFAEHGVRAAAETAPRIGASGEFRLPLLLVDHSFLCHQFLPP